MKHLFRKMLLAVALIAIAASANAQRVKYPGFHLGLRAGYSSNSALTKNDRFIHGGLSMDFRLGRNPFYLETGAYCMNKGYYTIGTERWNYGEYEEHLCPYYYVPLLFSYHFYVSDNIAIQPFAGVTAGYYDGPNSEGEASCRIGVGANWKRLYVNVGYDFGLIKHENNYYNAEFTNNTFFATLGFNIAGRR